MILVTGVDGFPVGAAREDPHPVVKEKAGMIVATTSAAAGSTTSSFR